MIRLRGSNRLWVLGAGLGLVGPLLAPEPGEAQVGRQLPVIAAGELRRLEAEIFAAINEVRTDPATLNARLDAIKAAQAAAPYVLTYPDPPASTLPVNNLNWLDTAIAASAGAAPLAALEWRSTLADSARAWAETNPAGHGRDTRAHASPWGGDATGNLPESINWGLDTTGLAHVYDLYIDDGVAGTGHRTMMIDPEARHVGVGCAPTNQNGGRVVCVVRYAETWVADTDTITFAPGKLYAVRNKNGTFKYGILKARPAASKAGDFVDLFACPARQGTLAQFYDELTTVGQALAEGLTPANMPCDGVEHALLKNGTALAIPPAPPPTVPTTATTEAEPTTTTTATTEAEQASGEPIVRGPATIFGEQTDVDPDRACASIPAPGTVTVRAVNPSSSDQYIARLLLDPWSQVVDDPTAYNRRELAVVPANSSKDLNVRPGTLLEIRDRQSPLPRPEPFSVLLVGSRGATTHCLESRVGP